MAGRSTEFVTNFVTSIVFTISSSPSSLGGKIIVPSMSSDFFDEPEEQSLVKAEIVFSYFDAWSRIMAKRAERVGYFDFFAGPGRYKTGEKSVPLLVLERAIASPDLRQRLV